MKRLGCREGVLGLLIWNVVGGWPVFRRGSIGGFDSIIGLNFSICFQEWFVDAIVSSLGERWSNSPFQSLVLPLPSYV